MSVAVEQRCGPRWARSACSTSLADGRLAAARTRRRGRASRRAAMVKLTPSTACTSPTRRCSRPPCTGKCFTSSVDLEHGRARAHARSAAWLPSRRPVMAGRRASTSGGGCGAAAVGRERAARREGAAGDRLASATARCRGSPQARPRAAARRRRRARDRAQQAARIGMQRAVEQRLDRRLLDLAAGIHHDHALRRSRRPRRGRG